MRKRGDTVVSNSDRLVRKVALAVDGTVVLATPVDTGRARSNWQVELNGPAEGVRDAYAPGEGGSTGGPNAREAIAQGRAAIAQYRGGDNASIHITNNLPYIGRLNEGSSAQAPAGFVESAVQVGVRAVRNTAQLSEGTIRET